MSPPVRAIDAAASEYPARLRELPDPPAVLYVAGSLPPVTPARVIAIVGTRRADPPALELAGRLGAELAGAGVAIISGGAEGIDAAAHRGALKAGAGTWVVQAAPLEAPYPSAHRALFDAALDAGGGWISETPPDQAPLRGRFLARNRIIAALADVVLVVQAPVRSGALSTARWARRLGRPVLAVPGAPWDPRAEGTLALLRAGAGLCVTARDAAEAVGMDLSRLPAAVQETLPFDPLPPELAVVYAKLSSRPSHPDTLAAATGLPVPRLMAILVRLAAVGRALPSATGWRAR